MIEQGTKFNRLTLISELPERRRGAVVGAWRCDCGKEKHAVIATVKAGHLKSCGCLRTKHGFASRSSGRSTEYVAWQAMNHRCSATQGRDYDAYGARGIGVCERWAEFENFLADMGRRPSKRHSVGRIDNNQGYSPENCRWETPRQQQTNQRKSLIYHIKGRVFESSREAAAHFGVDHKTIRRWTQTNKDGCHAVPRY